MVLSGTGASARGGWRVARSEQNVALLMYVLAVCRDDVSKRRSNDPRIQNVRLGVIVPTSPSMRQLIQEYGFFRIVLCTSFDAALAWFAYCVKFEIHLSFYGLNDPFFL